MEAIPDSLVILTSYSELVLERSSLILKSQGVWKKLVKIE